MLFLFCNSCAQRERPEHVNQDSVIAKAPFDDSGIGIFGRSLIKRSWKIAEISCRFNNGYVTYKVCINPEGKVVFAESLDKLSSIKNKRFVTKTANILLDYQYEVSDSIAYIQCGSYQLKMSPI